MDWLELGLSITTLICGGGWFINYRANKRKANAEAAQSEAEGWKAQQEVYQQTISDLKEPCDYIRNDRNLLREENTRLREENKAWRNKVFELEDMVQKLQGELARQGRKIESLSREIRSKK